MSSSEVILRATLEVFADEYRVTDADLGPHGEDLDARVLAAVVAYETGADPEAVATQFGVAEWVTETLANGSRNTPPDPLKRVVELSKMVAVRVESRSRGA